MIPPSTTITDGGRRLRRILVTLAALVVIANLVVLVASRLSGGGAVSGPAGSSFVTTRSGTAALAGTLQRLGVDVEQGRRTLDELELADATVVMVDPNGASYTSGELNSLDAHMRDGGRVVVAGQAGFVDRLFADAPAWRTAGAATASPAGPELRAAQVPLSGFGSLEPAEADEPLLVDDEGTVIALARPVGEGSFVWVADSFPFHNEGIGLGGAAVAVVDLIAPDDIVLFDEYRHGYREEGTLWALLPVRWRLTLLLAALVAVLALVAYGRRLGPPHDIERRLPPGRELYLDAVSGIMSRAGAVSDALGVIRAEARRGLEERYPGVDPRSAAASRGLDDEEIEAILGSRQDDRTLMAADRALAMLNRE